MGLPFSCEFTYLCLFNHVKLLYDNRVTYTISLIVQARDRQVASSWDGLTMLDGIKGRGYIQLVTYRRKVKETVETPSQPSGKKRAEWVFYRHYCATG